VYEELDEELQKQFEEYLAEVGWLVGGWAGGQAGGWVAGCTAEGWVGGYRWSKPCVGVAERKNVCAYVCLCGRTVILPCFLPTLPVPPLTSCVLPAAWRDC
jgi:hypothetical protein